MLSDKQSLRAKIAEPVVTLGPRYGALGVKAMTRLGFLANRSPRSQAIVDPGACAAIASVYCALARDRSLAQQPQQKEYCVIICGRAFSEARRPVGVAPWRLRGWPKGQASLKAKLASPLKRQGATTKDRWVAIRKRPHTCPYSAY